MVLTVRAEDNLAALRARSIRIPLRDTAEVAARRFANQLRENGWSVAIADTAVPSTDTPAKETWTALRDGSGYVTAYRVAVDNGLPETLAAIWALPSPETWTALEITGTATDPAVAVICTVRSESKPSAPVPGSTPLRGHQRPAIDALSPLSVRRLDASPVPVSGELLTNLGWPVEPRALTRT
jgi:type VII secretion protein EccE